MKKAYRKPELQIEKYELSTSIAASCESSALDYEAILGAYIQAGYTEQQMIEELNKLGIGQFCYHTSQGTGVFYS